MKRRRSSQEGGGNGKGKGNEGGNNSINNKKGTKKKKKKNPLLLHPQPPVLGTVATRTRRQEKEIATKWNQPIPILIHIMSYADPETIRTLCCVSKQCYDLIYNDPGMKNNRAVPLLVIRPSLDHDDDKGRIGRLLRFLWQHRDKLQRVRELKIIHAHKFGFHSTDEIERIEEKLRLYGVVSLDMSLPVSVTTHGSADEKALSIALASVLPNLQDIDLSGTKQYHCGDLQTFIDQCPHLDKITKNNIGRSEKRVVWIGGESMWSAENENLKEIYLDNTTFHDGGDWWRAHASDLEDDRYVPIFLFYECSSKLERISIRNAAWSNAFNPCDKTVVVPQNALIKFIRYAPSSLKWFRSNLSHENMDMLRSERPGIEFLN